MLRSVRKKIASSLSEIESGEDFLYNSWLRKPPCQKTIIRSITSSLGDTSEIGLSIDEPYSSQHFFLLNNSDLYPEENNYFFKKAKTNPVFFNLLIVPLKVTYLTDIEPKPAGYSARKIDFVFRINPGYDVPVLFNLPEPSKIKFKLRIPRTENRLENLRTKVVKIDLLGINDIVSVDDEKIAIKKIGIVNFAKLKTEKVKFSHISKAPKLFKIKVPGMGKYQSSVAKLIMKSFRSVKISKTPNLRFAGTPVTLNNFYFEKTNSLNYFDMKNSSSAEKDDKNLAGLKNPGQVKEVIKLLLTKVRKADWNKWMEAYPRLTKFEEEGAKFLVENERAFIGEELGIDKVKETLFALKFLIDNRVINSVLIISTKNNLSDNNIEGQYPDSSNWLRKLKENGTGISYSLVSGSDDERTGSWNKSALIHIAGYSTVFYDYHQKLLKDSRLAGFDCVILDEAEHLLDDNRKSAGLLKAIKPQVLWAISSIVNEDVLIKLNDSLSEDLRINNSKIRKLGDIPDEHPFDHYNENWLNMDEHQEFEYNETFKDCKKELRKILESVNPLRFQANIFTLLHKLYQVCNFAHGYDTNAKTELLMHHINVIKQNKKKALILSQYDRQGIKKLQKIFDTHKINYVTAQGGLSADELKKAISLFKSKKSVTVFLTNAKESSLDFGNYAIPYIIRFDSWWNPAIIVHSKDMFNSKKVTNNKSKTFVISYHIKDTIEEQIRRLLMDRGLLEKAFLKVLPLNTINDLLSVDDWVEIFGFPVERKTDTNKLIEETKDRIMNLSLGDYRATISKFLSALGYTRIDILEHENSASLDITGEGKCGRKNVYLFGRVIYDSVVYVKDIQDTILNAAGSDRNSVFIFTREKLSESVLEYAAGRDDLTLLDNYLLAKYLVNLNLIHQSEEQAE